MVTEFPIRGRDAGLTLVEVLVSASLLVLALVMFGGSLVTAQRAQGTNAQYSQANDQAHLALQAIDRQIRSGFVVGTTSVANADAAVKIYSEAGGAARCFAWAVADDDLGGRSGLAKLYVASWDPRPVGASVPSFPGSGWTAMASNLWNWLVSPQVEPFDVPTPATGVLKTLDVTLRLNASTRSEATIELTSSFTSRNVDREGEKIEGTGALKSSAC